MLEKNIEDFLNKLKNLENKDLESEDYRDNLYNQFNRVIETTIGESKLTSDQGKKIIFLGDTFKDELVYLNGIESKLPISSRVLNVFVLLSRAIAKDLKSNLAEQSQVFEEAANIALDLSKELSQEEKKIIQPVIDIDPKPLVHKELLVENSFVEKDSYQQLKEAKILLDNIRHNIYNGYEGEDSRLVRDRIEKFISKSGDKAMEAVINTVFPPLDLAEKYGMRSKVVRAVLIRPSLAKLEAIINNLGSSKLVEDFRIFRDGVSKIRFKDFKKEQLFGEELENPEELLDKLKNNLKRKNKIIEKIELSPKDFVKECAELVRNSKNMDEAKENLKEKLLRTIASSIYDTPLTIKNNLAHNITLKIEEDAIKTQGKKEFLKTTKDAISNSVKEEIERRDDDIYINERVHSGKIQLIKNKIDPIIDKAFEKLEKESNGNNKTGILAQKERSWYDFSGKIYDSLATAFRGISLIFGAEHDAKELFAKLSKAALNEKKAVDKAQKSKNNIIELSFPKNSESYSKIYEEYKNSQKNKTDK